MTVQNAYDNFIESRELANLSVKTIHDYQSFVSPFVNALGPDLDVKFISLDKVNKYILSLKNRPIRPATYATYVRHVKVFLRWVNDDFPLSFSLRKIRIPKTPKKVVHLYTDKEISLIFESVHAESDWLVSRNRALIALMLDSGLRQDEVCTLRSCNMDFDNMRIVVWGKGSKERILPLGRISACYIQQYLSLCPYEPGDFVFVTRRNEPISGNAVKLLLYKIACTLPFEFSSHKLRHNFATNYLLDQYRKHGHWDTQFLQIIMGHEDFKTTQKYLHLAVQIVATESRNSHLDQVLLG